MDLKTLSDAELVKRWTRGDTRAATEIVGRHADALARFAASNGIQGEIQELVQDTFVRAFGAFDSFRGDSALRTWLFTIERNLILDRRRADARSAWVDPIEAGSAATEYDALDALIAEETSEQIRKRLDSLSPMQRDVFRLRVEQGLSYKEIADVLETSEGAARVHYHNALNGLKELLNE